MYCQGAQEANDYIIGEATDTQTIAIGGSMTLSEMKIADKLTDMGKELLIAVKPGITSEEAMVIRRRQLTCDLFLTGTNAVTVSGFLVNIDNIGNRVGAMMFGPKKSILK